MRKILGVVAVVVLLAACANTGRKLSSYRTDAGSLMVGMTGEQAQKVMGPPDAAGRGLVESSWAKFPVLTPQPGSATIEWRWFTAPGTTVVAWMDGGIVAFVGEVRETE